MIIWPKAKLATKFVSQSFTTTPDSSSWVWSATWVNYISCQSFIAWWWSVNWLSLYKRWTTGTPTWNLLIKIVTNNAGNPSSTIVWSYTMPLATYNAIGINSEFYVPLYCAWLTIWLTYWITATDTVAETGSNRFNLWSITAWWYTWWQWWFSTDWWTTWTLWSNDMYFKIYT